MNKGMVGWAGQNIAKDRYTVGELLSQGSMAYVYLAHDRRLNTKVIIKTPRPELLREDADLAKRFTKEVQAMVKMAYPHIVGVVDFGMQGVLPFVVLQYLDGGSLLDRIRPMPHRQPTPQDVAGLSQWLMTIASTLDFIHQNDYVHRDVKPSNILFDSQQHVYLGDFGVVKAMSNNTTGGRMLTNQRQRVLGSPLFMAPELIQGQRVDGSMDQWSLAICVYEYLTARVPFTGATPQEVFQQQRLQAPVPLHEIRSELPASLWQALRVALSVEPADRYPTCAQFAQAVLQTVETANQPTATASKIAIAKPGQSQTSASPFVAAQPHIAPPPEPPQPSYSVERQQNVRRRRLSRRFTGSYWLKPIVTIAAAVVVTAILLAVIGKTQWPPFLAHLITPSNKVDADELKNANVELGDTKQSLTRVKQRLSDTETALNNERKRADENQKKATTERAHADTMTRKFNTARLTATAFKSAFVIQNKTPHQLEFEVRFRLWNGNYTNWQTYTDKGNDKPFVYTAPGGMQGEIKFNSTIGNPMTVMKNHTLRCEMIPLSVTPTVNNVRNKFYFNAYMNGTKKYVELLHQP